MHGERYDLISIGSGPAGWKACLIAAALGKRVACADKKSMFGGGCLNTVGVPSKALREAVLWLLPPESRRSESTMSKSTPDRYGASQRITIRARGA